MKKPSVKDSKRYVIELLSEKVQAVKEDSKVTREQTQELEFFINNGTDIIKFLRQTE